MFRLATVDLPMAGSYHTVLHWRRGVCRVRDSSSTRPLTHQLRSSWSAADVILRPLALATAGRLDDDDSSEPSMMYRSPGITGPLGVHVGERRDPQGLTPRSCGDEC